MGNKLQSAVLDPEDILRSENPHSIILVTSERDGIYEFKVNSDMCYVLDYNKNQAIIRNPDKVVSNARLAKIRNVFGDEFPIFSILSNNYYVFCIRYSKLYKLEVNYEDIDIVSPQDILRDSVEVYTNKFRENMKNTEDVIYSDKVR